MICIIQKPSTSVLLGSHMRCSLRSTKNRLWHGPLLSQCIACALIKVPALAPTQSLGDILAALAPAVANLQDATGLRPLDTVLKALEEGLPSEWDASYWSSAPGGPGWEPPLPTSTSTTWTRTTTVDLSALLCHPPSHTPRVFWGIACPFFVLTSAFNASAVGSGTRNRNLSCCRTVVRALGNETYPSQGCDTDKGL